jgi:hypothetical protein
VESTPVFVDTGYEYRNSRPLAKGFETRYSEFSAQHAPYSPPPEPTETWQFKSPASDDSTHEFATPRFRSGMDSQQPVPTWRVVEPKVGGADHSWRTMGQATGYDPHAVGGHEFGSDDFPDRQQRGRAVRPWGQARRDSLGIFRPQEQDKRASIVRRDYERESLPVSGASGFHYGDPYGPAAVPGPDVLMPYGHQLYGPTFLPGLGVPLGYGMW